MTLGFSTQMFGKPNHFVEKILSGMTKNIGLDLRVEIDRDYLPEYSKRTGNKLSYSNIEQFFQKIHTIRAGNRWKDHQKIHFVIGNRTKYRFQFAPVLPVNKIQEIEIIREPFIFEGKRQKGDKCKVIIDGRRISNNEVFVLAENDGFDSLKDFLKYFNTDFKGQLIHWTDKVY